MNSIKLALTAALAASIFPCSLAFPALLTGNPEHWKHTIRNIEANPYGFGNYNVTELADLVTRALNGSFPGVEIPAVPLAGIPVPITIELPPAVEIGRKVIPDAAHPFQPPGPGDQRGGCPGLNTMANYGYISRNGITSATELLYALPEMFGLGTDSAAVLVALSLLSAMDPTSLKMSIGTKDSRTNGPLSPIFGTVSGLFDKASHNAYEIDGSVAYINSGQASDGITSHFSSDLWAEAASVANATDGLFDNRWVGEIRYKRYQECIAQDPSCYWGVKEILFYAAHGFIHMVVPWSDVNGLPTAPTYDKASRFWGASQTANGTYVHVPEQLTPSPDGNWYRRGFPLTVVELGADGDEAYLQHPVLFGGNNGKVNSFIPIPDQVPSALNSTFLCTAFNAYQEVVPSQYASIKEGLIDLSNIFLAPARVALACP